MTEQGVDVSSVASALSASGVRVEGDLHLKPISGGRSNYTAQLSDRSSRWILRAPPAEVPSRGAHDLIREVRVIKALAASAIPVAAIVLDATTPAPGAGERPYYVMEEVEGIVLRTRADVAALDEGARRTVAEHLIDTMAALHEVDPVQVGLSDFGRPDGFLLRQLNRWRRQYHAISERHARVVDRLAATLERCLPDSPGPSLLHGDYRLDNVIVSSSVPPRLAAVLDWEMSTLGDPGTDLGALLMFWDEEGSAWNPVTQGLMAFSGMPSRDEVVTRYLAARSMPLDPAAIAWYGAFARLKLAVILEQLHVRASRDVPLADHAHRSSGSSERFDVMVDQLLDEVDAMSSEVRRQAGLTSSMYRPREGDSR